jgi:hypothetical protein
VTRTTAATAFLTIVALIGAWRWANGTYLPASAELLAYTSYNPGTAQNISTSSSSFADVDATNLKVTFTVPPSGKVLIRQEATATVNNGAAVYAWNLRTTGGSDVTGSSHVISATGSMTRPVTTTIVTGLTPGASVTYRWGHAVSSNSGFTRCGDDGTASQRYGPAIMEVWRIP